VSWKKYGTQELRKRPATTKIHLVSFEGVLLQEALPKRSSFGSSAESVFIPWPEGK
jgi:hypothetical protein